MNYYHRHLGDYAKKTSHLSMLEDGAYNRLMDVYYSRESGLPDAEAERLCRCRTSSDRKALRSVLAEFFVLGDGLWHNKRCDEEIAEYHKKADIARKNGVKGGRPKTQRVPENNPVGSLRETKLVPAGNPEGTGSQAPSSQEPVTSNQINTPLPPAIAPHLRRQVPKSCFSQEDIRGIYLAYPRHSKPEHAYRAIAQALAKLATRPDVADPVVHLLKVVRDYAAARQGQEKRFTPHPASWMNAGSYDDDPETWKKGDTNERSNGYGKHRGTNPDDPIPSIPFYDPAKRARQATVGAGEDVRPALPALREGEFEAGSGHTAGPEARGAAGDAGGLLDGAAG